MSDTDSLFQKWKGWVEGDLRYQFENLIHSHRIAEEFNESLKPFTGQEAGADLVMWMLTNYVVSICLAIRRLDDRGKRSISLRTLLDDLRDHADVLTEDNLERHHGGRIAPCLTAEEILYYRQDEPSSLGESPSETLSVESALDYDLALLGKFGDTIRLFVNKFLAHHDANAHHISLPTYGEVEDAINCFHFLYRKWGLILAGISCQLDNPNPLDLLPMAPRDHKGEFTRMWRALSST
jgi:hypothetical protein